MSSNHKKNLFFGIDYGMLSPGFCAISLDSSISNIDQFEEYLRAYNPHDLLTKILHFMAIGYTTNTAYHFDFFDYYFMDSNFLNDVFGVDRYSNMAQQVIDWMSKIISVERIGEDDSIFVGIEGYSFASHKGRTFSIGENTGILKYALRSVEDTNDIDLHIETYAPTTVKKLATGSGRAGKDEMRDAFYEFTDFELGEILNVRGKKTFLYDLIDAFWVMVSRIDSFFCDMSKKEQNLVGE